MIFLNNSSAGAWSGRHITFSGSISRNGANRENGESDNFLLGCIVGSFGIAITLALILLPLSICCSTVVYHPFYVFGLVTFILLTLFGGILCVCYPIMIKCWRYRESSKDSNAQHRKDSASKIYSPYGEDAASASLNDLENQQDISPVAGNMGSPSHVAFVDEKDRS